MSNSSKKWNHKKGSNVDTKREKKNQQQIWRLLHTLINRLNTARKDSVRLVNRNYPNWNTNLRPKNEQEQNQEKQQQQKTEHPTMWDNFEYKSIYTRGRKEKMGTTDRVEEIMANGAPEWISWLSIRFLISAQVLISGLWIQAPCWAPCWEWSLLYLFILFFIFKDSIYLVMRDLET